MSACLPASLCHRSPPVHLQYTVSTNSEILCTVISAPKWPHPRRLTVKYRICAVVGLIKMPWMYALTNFTVSHRTFLFYWLILHVGLFASLSLSLFTVLQWNSTLTVTVNHFTKSHTLLPPSVLSHLVQPTFPPFGGVSCHLSRTGPFICSYICKLQKKRSKLL